MVLRCSSLKAHLLRILPCKFQSANSFVVVSCLLKDHYHALGVHRNATHADIKAAYYKLSKLYHPDRNETPEAAESFRNITEAYEIIGNFKLRRMYDKGLLGHAVDNGTRRTYTNYDPSSSYYKNKPTHSSRTSTYNFDEWSRSHYEDTFSRRYSAKMKYDVKVDVSHRSKSHSRSENVAYIMIAISIIWCIISNFFSSSLDDPSRNPPKKQ